MTGRSAAKLEADMKKLAEARRELVPQARIPNELLHAGRDFLKVLAQHGPSIDRLLADLLRFLVGLKQRVPRSSNEVLKIISDAQTDARSFWKVNQTSQLAFLRSLNLKMGSGRADQPGAFVPKFVQSPEIREVSL